MLTKVVKRLLVFDDGQTLWLPPGVRCERCSLERLGWVMTVSLGENDVDVHFPADEATREKLAFAARIMGEHVAGELGHASCVQILKAALDSPVEPNIGWLP